MSEAVITRGGIGGDNVSNETKQMIGLDNSATLDDVIDLLYRRDPDMATVIVTVRTPTGKIVPNATVKFTPVQGSILNYQCNEEGQCTFKTNAGQGNFIETSYSNDYVDSYAKPLNNIPLIIGNIYQLNLFRAPVESVNINSNKNIKFSEYVNSVDVHCFGAGAGGGTAYNHTAIESSYANCRYIVTNEEKSSTNFLFKNFIFYTVRYGGNGGNGYYNKKTIYPSSNTNYNCFVGKGGNSTESRIYVGYSNGSITRDNSYHWCNFSLSSCTQNFTMGPGFAGGSTSFGGILSATGGGNPGTSATSSANGTSGTGGFGAKGGDGGVLHLNNDGGIYYSKSNSSQYLYINGIWATGGYGQDGYIILNNFTYK